MYYISPAAENVISRLEDYGFEAYLVGGCVRDMLMNRACNDIDITTNATPDKIKEVFSECHCLDIGIKHGTVTVITQGVSVEITTYRKETTYSDCRHPDRVIFSSSLTEDLSRRDFTSNAIAYNPRKGIVDPFGGRQDINDKCLRCVGDPAERFSEDALRILRALRFSSVLGFTIEDKTLEAIKSCKELIALVSPERIAEEISKMLCGDNVASVLIDFCSVLSVPLPEIAATENFQQHNFHHIFDVLHHTARVVEATPALPVLRLAALFHDCGKPHCFSLDDKGVGHFYGHARISAEMAETALTRLRFDKATKEKVVRLVKIHDTPIEPEASVIKKKLRKYGEELFFLLISLQRADNLGLSPDFHYRQSTYDEIEKIARQIIEENQCFSLKDLAVNGEDMLSLGLRGKAVGDALDKLLLAVIEEKCSNSPEALIEYYHFFVKNS